MHVGDSRDNFKKKLLTEPELCVEFPNLVALPKSFRGLQEVISGSAD
jgi:hypothetical protein